MANAQYTINSGDRSDTSAFTVPGDEDGGAGDDSFQVDTDTVGPARRWYIHIDNGWDVSVDVTPQGSHYRDESMASAGEDGSAVTVASGDVDFIDGESGHAFLEVSVTPASAPSSGDLTITYQSREW